MSQILIPYNTNNPAYPVKKNKKHFILATELTQQLLTNGKSVKIGLSVGRRYVVVHLCIMDPSAIFMCKVMLILLIHDVYQRC